MNLNRLAILGVMLACVAGPVFAQDAKDIAKHAGYIDIDLTKVFPKALSQAEITLEGPILKMIGGAAQEHDPDFAKLVLGLDLVRVRSYAVSDVDLNLTGSKVETFAKKLENDAWKPVVKVREENEFMNIFYREKDGNMVGLVIVGMDHNEAVFINIAGVVDYETLGKVGGKFLGEMAKMESLSEFFQDPENWKKDHDHETDIDVNVEIEEKKEEPEQPKEEN